MKIQNEEERKMGLEDKRQLSQDVSKLKMIVMITGFGILTWIRSSMLTMLLLEKLSFCDMCFLTTIEKPGQKLTFQVKAPSNEIVINNKILELVRTQARNLILPQPLLKTKVRCNVFHYDKRQAPKKI